MDFNATAVYSMGLAGYELMPDERGENIFYRLAGLETPQRVHRAKVRYTNTGAPYFLAAGRRRIHLNECLRV